MTPLNYSDLFQFATPHYGIDEIFFDTNGEHESCIFLVSCLNHEAILYIDDSFEAITGYSKQTLVDKGLSFWFPLIHQEDMPALSDNIKKSYAALSTPGFQRPFPPLILEYRFKGAAGDWIKIRETKYLLLEENETAVDKVLCKFELLEQSCNKLLDFALAYDAKVNDNQDTSSIPPLTKREKEILVLIAKGLSSKMIADKCSISINTVETHRRHLLEKLNVKNSMELIKEASKIFQLD